MRWLAVSRQLAVSQGNMMTTDCIATVAYAAVSTRRRFLQTLAATSLTAPLVPAALAQAMQKVRVQLGWVPNVQYAGEWVALDRGIFNANGLSVEWLPGGPNALAAPVVLAAGKADLGYSTWFPILDAVMKGNPLVIVAA